MNELSQAHKGYGYGGTSSTSALNIMPQAAPPRTIKSALSSLENLNSRLADLSMMATQIAQSIGGPFPTSGSNAKAPDLQKPSMIESINDGIDAAHYKISELNDALSAMSRSLGS